MKKAAKGKSPEIIAQELEEEVETIRRLIEQGNHSVHR